MIHDADGVLRRSQILLRKNDTVYPTLAAETLRVAQNSKTYVARAASSDRLASLIIGKYNVPTDSAGQVRLYDTGPVPQRIVPAWRVINGGQTSGPNDLSTKFKGAIVFIGSSALGIEDVQHSPLSTVTLGVTIHSQIAEQILSGDFLIRPDWTSGLEIMATVLFCVLLVLVLRRVFALIGFTLVVISLSVALAYSWLAFSALVDGI